jgi:hypothetical protein
MTEHLGEESWPSPIPRSPEAVQREHRLGSAVVLFLVALAAGGLAVGLFYEEGFAAAAGQRGIAHVQYCTTGRHPSCTAVVRKPTGELLDRNAEMANFSAMSGSDVRVRYRAGKAVPDSPGDQLMRLLLVAIFAVGSVVALGAAVNTLSRLGDPAE